MALTTAYSGAPAGRMPFDNAFGFTFSQPFQHESDFTPANHRVPKVNDEQPIFVDNKSGMLSSADVGLYAHKSAVRLSLSASC